MSTPSTGASNPLSRVSGVIALVGALTAIVGNSLFGWGLLPTAFVLVAVAEILLAIAGGVLCLSGKVNIGPWLIAAAFIVGEVLQRIVLGPSIIGTTLWPYQGVVYFADNTNFGGSTYAQGLLLIDLTFWILLAASILAIIAFVKSRSVSTTPSVSTTQPGGSVMSDSQGSVPAGWYPDPDGKPVQRYWDGSAWTEQNRPSVGQPLPSMPAARVGTGPQNGMGSAALTLGILGFFCFPLIASVLAIIFGRIGMTRAEQGLATNGGAAKAGFILGIIGLVLGGIGLIIWGAALSSSSGY